MTAPDAHQLGEARLFAGELGMGDDDGARRVLMALWRCGLVLVSSDVGRNGDGAVRDALIELNAQQP